MSDPVLEPDHVKTVVLDLIKADRRDLAWNLIDHYFSKASALTHYDVLGFVSQRADKRDTYLKCAEISYSLAATSEQLYTSRINLVKAYNTMNLPDEALFYIEQNLAENPDDFEMLCHRAFNYSLKGDRETAEKILFELMEKYPDKRSTLDSALSGRMLREGKIAEGILSFVGKFHPDKYFFSGNCKKWNGIIMPGHRLYVDAEGGYGDLIINIRFFDRLKRFGMRPILITNASKYYQSINQVFERHGYEVLTDNICVDDSEQWVPMLGLPGYLGLKESQLWSGPYLRPLRQERNRVDNPRFKVGIKNQGNPYFAQDEYRKIPIEEIVAAMPENCDLYYFDKKPCPYKHPRLTDLSERIDNWDDTLDLLDQMDCVVSSCTSIVHAAGAMGKTTFVMVPIAEYYIWTTSKTDGSSPWYGDNFFVARQTRLRSWKEPLTQVSGMVQKLINQHDQKL